MSIEASRQKAAQAWCQPSTSGKQMDPVLCEAFAEILEEIWSQPWLGNATTGQLLDEIKARVNCNYKTVGGEIIPNPETNKPEQIRMNTGFCDRHQYPYGAEDTSGPICPWCERLRVERLEAEVKDLLETRGDLERQLTEICTDNLTLIHWLKSAKYRTIMHRHDETFQAVDETSQERFSADTFSELAEILATVQAGKKLITLNQPGASL